MGVQGGGVRVRVRIIGWGMRGWGGQSLGMRMLLPRPLQWQMQPSRARWATARSKQAGAAGRRPLTGGCSPQTGRAASC